MRLSLCSCFRHVVYQDCVALLTQPWRSSRSIWCAQIARAEKQERILSRVFTYTPLALAGLGVALYAKQNPQSALGKLLHL